MPRGHEHDLLYSFSMIWSFTLNFSGEKAVIITSKHGTTIYFAHYNRILSLERRALILSEYIGMYSCPLDIP